MLMGFFFTRKPEARGRDLLVRTHAARVTRCVQVTASKFFARLLPLASEIPTDVRCISVYLPDFP